MTEAYYVAALTRARGWSEAFVRWQLPPWRGFAYLHADLLQQGEEVLWADRESDPRVLAFRRLRDEIRARYARPTLTQPKSDGQ